MPFSARISSVCTDSLSAGLSQPRGALPTLAVIVSTTSVTSARSSASGRRLSRIELVVPWPIHSQLSFLPSSMMRGYSLQTSELSATVPRMP